MQWKTSAWRSSDGSCAFAETSTPVDVRAHSLAGLRGTRRGDITRLTASLRVYHSVRGSMVPWSGRPVVVQRFDGRSWQWVASTTSDRSGDVAVDVRLPRGTAMRVVTADMPSAWGATSPTYRL
ncbi:hypothetical protein [uncultured Pseudokineococcus sp.]|uniref:hypothetical protein n=1 Tax=uncultured Pseudokineococcus sp. TaxID=1642928 RepID=UPI0026279238|nr:hypothetical protein [uncultured Pseudokineococcus sp.]